MIVRLDNNLANDVVGAPNELITEVPPIDMLNINLGGIFIDPFGSVDEWFFSKGMNLMVSSFWLIFGVAMADKVASFSLALSNF